MDNVLRLDVPAVVPADEPIQQRPATGRNEDGTFSAGNSAAETHGRYSRRMANLAEKPEVRALLAEREAAIKADLGDNVSALAEDMVSRYVGLQLVEEWLLKNLTDKGVLTSKGAQRAALTAFLQVADRSTRIAVALGLERKARKVQTLDDYMAGGRAL